MAYFDKHIFFCLNDRGNKETCCFNYGAKDLQSYAKDKIKELVGSNSAKIRVNRAGCLSRCDNGPVMVIYPEGIWYQFVDKSDIDEIIETHILANKIVKRLQI